MSIKIAAMVLAGGKGTRLQALTRKMAKPAVSYGGKYRIIDFPLSNCANSGINHVGVDDDAGGQMAGEYLGQMGHKQVAFIANYLEDSEVDQHRLQGYKNGLEKYGIRLLDENIFATPLAAVDESLINSTLNKENAPSAFFCTSDRVAVQLMQTLHKMHISIPEKVSVLGFDNLPIAEITYPPLTTLAQDITQKAHLVVDMLVRHIKKKTLPPERTLLGVWLVERESVKRI